MKYCPQTGKSMYETRERAQEILEHQEKLNPAKKLRMYMCQFCFCWHLTHTKNKHNMH